jgi:membrane protease YdiL (CAAX protease family)
MREKMDSKPNKLIWLQIGIIYALILLEYPFGMAFSQIVFHRPLATSIEPTYLLIWGLIRIALILPLTYNAITNLGFAERRTFKTFGDFRRGATVTFWGTFFFVVVGALFYQVFLRPTNLSVGLLLLNIPIFLAYAVTNAIVEETFFRGLLMHKLSMNLPFWFSNLLQSASFAAIHFINPMSQSTMLFVGLTFILGLLWGYTTRKFESVVPAVAMHVIADIFVAVSLF